MLGARDCLACAVAAGILAPALHVRGDLTQEIAQLIAGKVEGGETGFLLRRINGPVLAADQPAYLFYPASSIKVVQHLHAMLEVEEPGGVDLATMVTVYDDSDESCEDDHDGHTPTFRTLEDVLRRMMENSDNEDTNAVQELFGRPAINATAHAVVGMSAATQLNHKFGCLGPDSDPANQMPLVDSTLLYERVALGEIFSLESTRQKFYELMLTDGNANSIKAAVLDMVEEEAAAFAIHVPDLADFKNGIRMAWKAGSYGGEHESIAGWILLPKDDCTTLPDREYVFASFFDLFTDKSAEFGPDTVVVEMMRGEVRAALEDWESCNSCGAPEAGPCNEAHGLPGCDDSTCCQAVCLVDPLCCDTMFGWDAACVSQAIAICDLSPHQDACAAAVEIENCWLSSFDISNATNDGFSHLEECDWPADLTKDVWYKYTATSTGILTVRVCSEDEPNDPSDPFNLWLGAYDSGDCGPLLVGSLIDCTSGTAACGVSGVDLDIPVVEGLEYKIRIAAGNPLLGKGKIETFCVEPGDNKENPNFLGLFEGPASLSTTNASTDGPAHAACLGAGDDQIHNDVWFIWIAPCTGSLVAETCGAADFDTRLAVYATCSAAPPSDENLVGCNDDAPSCADYGSRLSVPVTGGFCYLIRAGGYNGGRGTGTLTIACHPPCPADLDGDGAVGIVDFLTLLAAWGPNAGHPADLNGDGLVGIVDFLGLLAAWGPCP